MPTKNMYIGIKYQLQNIKINKYSDYTVHFMTCR